MKGYTIQHSIDLLEKAVEKIENTPAPTVEVDADEVSYDNTSSGLTADDVQAAIDELNTAIGQIDTGDNYSETEMVIGKWIDGSDIYRKVIDFGALPNATAKTVAHGISDLNILVAVYGVATNTARNSFLPINACASSSQGAIYQVGATVSNTDVYIETGTDRSAYGTTYVVLEYTKTPAQSTRSKKTKKEE